MPSIPEFLIRAATPEDCELIHRLIRELADFEKLSHEVTATPELLRESLFGEKRSAEVLIGEENGVGVGFALFFHNYSTFLGRQGLYLEDLYVRPEYRSRGYGRMLLRKLSEIAEERGCGRMEWSVLDWNRDAIRFYRSIDAQPMSDWTVFRLLPPFRRLREPQ